MRASVLPAFFQEVPLSDHHKISAGEGLGVHKDGVFGSQDIYRMQIMPIQQMILSYRTTARVKRVGQTSKYRTYSNRRTKCPTAARKDLLR